MTKSNWNFIGVLLEPGLLAKLLRTLAKFIRKPESFTEKHTAYNKIQKSFNDLMAHEEVISAHPATAEFLVRLFARLRSQDTAFGPVDFTEDFLTTAFGVWKTNGFEIMNLEETQSIGAGIYIPHSAINHSCRPNAVRVCKVDLMEIRCIHPVPEGQEPTISYLAGNRTREERQAVLKSKFGNVKVSNSICINFIRFLKIQLATTSAANVICVLMRNSDH